MSLKLAIGALALAATLALPGVSKAQDNPSDSTQMVTGCLQKSGNTFTLLDENGKLWDVHSKTVKFAPHVGHTVTLTGTIPQKSEDQNKQSGDASPQNHLRVTNLKMVSETCEQKG